MSIRRSPLLFLLVAVLALVLAEGACGGNSATKSGSGGSSGGVTATESPAAAAATPVDQAVSWRNAADHIGETATIVGPVAGTFYDPAVNGEPTFLNVGRDYPDPDRFTVVIWGDDRGAFPGAPESMYKGRTIRVTGFVSEYEGRPQVEITWPGAIEVVD